MLLNADVKLWLDDGCCLHASARATVAAPALAAIRELAVPSEPCPAPPASIPFSPAGLPSPDPPPSPPPVSSLSAAPPLGFAAAMDSELGVGRSVSENRLPTA